MRSMQCNVEFALTTTVPRAPRRNYFIATAVTTEICVRVQREQWTLIRHGNISFRSASVEYTIVD
jgi:hypothetical protein